MSEENRLMDSAADDLAAFLEDDGFGGSENVANETNTEYTPAEEETTNTNTEILDFFETGQNVDFQDEPEGEAEEEDVEGAVFGFNNNVPTLGADPEDQKDPSEYPCYSLKRYRGNFDIDTKGFLQRIVSSIVPKVNSPVTGKMRENPDFYGPIWITVTLIFVVALCNNLIAYYETYTSGKEFAFKWSQMSTCGGIFLGYGLLMPAIFWLVSQGFMTNVPTLKFLYCVYGYSLIAYLPIFVLFVFTSNTVRTVLIVLVAAFTAFSLFTRLWSQYKDSKTAVILLIVFMGIHAVLGLATKVIFL
ncbi:hypothetical protein PCE1_001819 [Barthelona sp. PCE]